MSPVRRSAEATLATALETFRVVAIVGPRQAGKTTLARMAGDAEGRTFVTLDDLAALSFARGDPQGFVKGLRIPATIDEVQRAPDLLLAIKQEVDRVRRPGAFLLTGSADPGAVQGVRETLAGRMAMIPLRPLTWAERLGRPGWNPVSALLACASVREVLGAFGRSPPVRLDVEVPIGGFPEPALRLKAAARGDWHEQFARTYLAVDVPLLVRPDDAATFFLFLRLAAAATGGILNIADFARDAGLSHDTARRWLSVLQSTYVAETLHPYWRNVRKRLAKAPKLHFADTGLAMNLLGLHDWDSAVRMNLAGALTESWVHHHLQAFRAAAGKVNLHFFRSLAGDECDFVLEREGTLVPLEVKASQTLGAKDTAGLRTFLELFPRAPFGIVLYPGSEALPLGERLAALPMAGFLAGSESNRL